MGREPCENGVSRGEPKSVQISWSSQGCPGRIQESGTPRELLATRNPWKRSHPENPAALGLFYGAKKYLKNRSVLQTDVKETGRNKQK